MITWIRLLRYRFMFIRNYAKTLNERASVEQYLLDCANGTRPLPDRDKCRLLALQLGVRGYVKCDL